MPSEQAHLAARMDALAARNESRGPPRSTAGRPAPDAGVLQTAPVRLRRRWTCCASCMLPVRAEPPRQRDRCRRMRGEDCPVRSDRRLPRRAPQNFLEQRDALRPRRRRCCRSRRGDIRSRCRCGTPGRASRRAPRADLRGSSAARPTWRGAANAASASACRSASASPACSTIRWTCAPAVGPRQLFSIRVGRAAALPLPPARPRIGATDASLADLRLLCGTTTRRSWPACRPSLDRWQVDAHCATTVDGALALAGTTPRCCWSTTCTTG